jgi:hypothetical protein
MKIYLKESRRKLCLLSILIFVFLSLVNSEEINAYEYRCIKKINSTKNLNLLWKQKEIIVTTWNVSEPDSDVYPIIAKEKYNLVVVNDQSKGFNLAANNDLKIMLSSNLLDPANLEDPIKLRRLENLIHKVKKSCALEAYFITDEPSASKFSGLAELVSYLHKTDPGRLAYINLLPTYANEQQLGISSGRVSNVKNVYPKNLHGIGPDNNTVLTYLEYLRQFVFTVKPDMISYDHYHLFEDGDSPHYFLNLALISQVSKESKIPFMNVIQAGRYEKKWRLPTTQEVRLQVYTTLAYGGRGISYFTYWGSEANEGLYRDGRQSRLAKDVAVINGEIRKLSSTLMSLDPQSVYHTKSLPVGAEPMPINSPIKIVSDGEFVVGLFGKNKKASAFMIVSRNNKRQQSAEIKINLLGRIIQELDRKTGNWKKVCNLKTSRQIKLILEPGDGRLFRVI